MQAAIEEVRLPKSIVPVMYEIHYEDIDLKKWTFSGYVDIELNVKEEADFVMLNAKELSIHSANITVDSEEKEVEQITILKKQQRVVFHLDEALKVGTIKLHVQFSGALNDYMQGFYRSKYSVDGEEKYMATTQFESTDARMAFPCWDEPALKARFRVFLSAPVGYTAVSNMPIMKKITITDHGMKKNVFEFDETPIMSTYLLAFVIGEFDMISGFSSTGVQVNCFTPLGKSEWGQFALTVGLHSISYYADFFHVEYPLKKLDLLPIPDFAAGAMENWGCVTFREVDLLIDEKTASIANKHRVAIVVAHEIAHMWFGDLVTMEWWTHLWLNEGFASYMEYVCVEALFPSWQIFTEFYNDSICTAFYDDSFTSTHPIEVPVKYPEEIDQIFDGISYNKGSAVIHMLVNYLGDDAFRKGMELYLNRHKYGNTCTEDLWRALGEGSGQDCEAIMKDWTQEPGYPLIVLEENEDGLMSHQQVFYSNPTEPVKSSSWMIPLSLVTPSGTQQYLYKNETKADFVALITKLKSEHRWLKINQNTLCIVQYTPAMLAALKEAVAACELSALDRIQLLLDLKRLCNAQRVKPSEVLSFMEAYTNEKEESVLEIIATVLMSFYEYVEEKDTEIRTAFQALTSTMLRPAYERCGWDARSGESTYATTSRPIIISVLLSICDDSVVRAEALRRFDLLMKRNDESVCHTEIRLLCMREGVKQGDEEQVSKTINQLMKKYEETTGAEKRRIIAAVGQAVYPSILRHVLGYCLDGTVRKQDTYSSFASVTRNKVHRKLCWEYLRENMSKLQESLKGSFNMLGYFVEAGGSVLDNEEELTEFMKFFGDSKEMKEVSRSIDSAEQNIKMNIVKKQYMTKYIREYFQ